jgi:hypothetical protein
MDGRGTVGVWCENAMKDILHFYLAQRIKLSEGLPVQVSWINIHKYFNNFTKPPEYSFGNTELGVYSISTQSTHVVLAILVPNQSLNVFSISNLFNVGKQLVIQKIYSYSEQDIIEALSRILKISVENNNINIIGLDSHDNLMEIEFDIVHSFHAEKHREQHDLPECRAKDR